jgi:G3E family GTPase
MTHRIPITLLVGFLGSGKTTLINNILSVDSGKRIAIIENEFGEISLDQEFIKEGIAYKKGELIIEMNNGCLCCSINGDLVNTLQNLLEKKNDFDHIIIEATGMASPGPIIQTLRNVKIIDENFLLTSVVTIVDSFRFFDNLENTKSDKEFNFEQQLIYSDLIILNKIDLIEEELLEFKMNQIISFVKKMNSYAELIQSKNCLISIQALLNRDKQDISKIDNLSISKNDQHKYQHGKGEISQISLENTGDYNPELFQLFLNALFITYRNRLFRIKAVLSFPDNNRRILLQGVYDQLQFEQGSIKEKDHINKFVFIGIGLKIDIINKSLENCLLSA